MTGRSLSKRDVFRRLREAARDPARLGDVAVYKSELLGIRARPDVEARLAARPTIPRVEVEQLLTLPLGTLGRVYAEFLRDHGLRPFTLSDRIEPEVLARNIFTARYALVHDVFHVLTGFDTSWAGEAGVWAFVAAQDYAGYPRFASAATRVVYPCFDPRQTFAVWRCAREGAAMGRRAESLIDVPFEELWDRELQGLRGELGIEPPRGLAA